MGSQLNIPDLSALEQHNLLSKKESEDLIHLIDVDPASALVKMRKVIERIIQYHYTNIFEESGDKRIKLAEMIYKLNQKGELTDIINIYLNTIRLSGNVAAHNKIESKADVDVILPMFFHLIEWFINYPLKDILVLKNNALKQNEPISTEAIQILNKQLQDLELEKKNTKKEQLANLIQQGNIVLDNLNNSLPIYTRESQRLNTEIALKEKDLQQNILLQKRKFEGWHHALTYFKEVTAKLQEREKWVEECKKSVFDGGKPWRMADCKAACLKWNAKSQNALVLAHDLEQKYQKVKFVCEKLNRDIHSQKLRLDELQKNVILPAQENIEKTQQSIQEKEKEYNTLLEELNQ
jgi:Domain of unknown function (DUF4145)